jgi:hypothetical protein
MPEVKVTVKFTIDEMYSMLPDKIKEALDSLIKTSQDFGIDSEESKQIFIPIFFKSYWDIVQSKEKKE